MMMTSIWQKAPSKLVYKQGKDQVNKWGTKTVAPMVHYREYDTKDVIKAFEGSRSKWTKRILQLMKELEEENEPRKA